MILFPSVLLSTVRDFGEDENGFAEIKALEKIYFHVSREYFKL